MSTDNFRTGGSVVVKTCLDNGVPVIDAFDSDYRRFWSKKLSLQALLACSKSNSVTPAIVQAAFHPWRQLRRLLRDPNCTGTARHELTPIDDDTTRLLKALSLAADLSLTALIDGDEIEWRRLATFFERTTSEPVRKDNPRAEIPEFSKIRNPLMAKLLKVQLETGGTPAEIERVNREFARKNRSQLGKTEAERVAAMKSLTDQTRTYRRKLKTETARR